MDMGDYRHELKFLCGEQELYFMGNKICHICRRDINTDPDGTYVVKSLYFDTPDDRCYHENQAGVDRRRKYRIRIYNNNPDTIKLECKSSCHGRKRKEACSITRQQCEALLKGTACGIPTGYFAGSASFAESGYSGRQGNQEALWQRFQAERKTDMLVPKVIVEYRRTPYIFPAGNVRITFDRAIRSSSYVGRFFDKDIPFRSIMPEGRHILEVKYDEAIPAAILELLSAGRELRRISFSKYALCREYSII